MQTTSNYGYKVVEGTDSPVNIQNDIAPNFTDIDTDLKAVSDSAITTATHVLSGGVHALTRADADRSTIIFTATGDMTTGDTFTVDGVSVTARLVNGEALQTGSFKINNTVMATLVGTILNVNAINPVTVPSPAASAVSYDNTTSGLTATDVQNAIDEVDASLDTAQTDITNLQNALGTIIKQDSVAGTTDATGGILLHGNLTRKVILAQCTDVNAYVIPFAFQNNAIYGKLCNNNNGAFLGNQPCTVIYWYI